MDDFLRDEALSQANSNADSSHIKQIFAAFTENQERLEMAITGAELALWDIDLESGKACFTSYWAEMLGYSPAELEETVEQWKSLVHPNDLDNTLSALTNHIDGKTDTYCADFRMFTKSGDWKWIQSKGKVFQRNRDGKAIRAVGIHQDIDDQKKLEQQLKALSLAIESSPAAIVVTSTKPRIIYVNKKFCELSGYQQDEVIGQNPRILQSGKTSLETYQSLWKTISSKEPWTGELWNKNKNGQLRLESLSISPILDNSGEISSYVAVKQDITEQRKMEETIWRQANFDSLTGLCNRDLFLERTQIAINRAIRHHYRILVLYLDLDHFKPINDNYGHSIGDEVLQEFSLRLKSAIRNSDITARLGGDEFSAVIEDLRADQTVESMIQNLTNELTEQPYSINAENGSTTAALGVSIGYSIFPDDGTDLDRLLSHADASMYRSKKKPTINLVLHP